MAEVARWEPTVIEEKRGLVGDAQRGDRVALDKLLQAYEGLIWRLCRALLPPEEDVEGAVQDVMVKVIKGVRSLRGEEALTPWVARVAVNHCRDLLRRRKVLRFVPLERAADDEEEPMSVQFPASDPDPENVLRAKQGMERLMAALGMLSDRQREVFALRFFGQMDLKAVAASLGGMDVGTVKTHLHRALARLRPYVWEAWP